MQDLKAATNALLLQVSAVPEDEAAAMNTLKNTKATKNIRERAGALEAEVQKRMKSCTEKINEQQKIIAALEERIGC